MDPERLMEGISTELEKALKAMAKAKTVEEKAAHSQIVRDMSESLGVFLNLATNMVEMDFDEEDF